MTNNPIVTGLTSYVEEHKSELLSHTLLDGKSREMFNLMTDVKGDTALNIMESEIHFQPLACGWNESGSTEFSQRLLHPASVMAEIGFCDKNLLRTYLQYQVKVGAGKEEMPFEQKWTEQIIGLINEKIEKMLYQGQSGQTNECEGLVSILDNDANTIKVNKAKGTSAYAFLKDVAMAIPANVKNPVILCSTPLYREFMQDLVAANLYHYDPANGANEYLLPGTDIKVIAVDGLNGAAAEYVIAANLNNIFYGVSADDDDSTFDFWYSKDNREFRFAWAAVMGVQVAFPDEIVLGTRAKA